MNASVVEKLDVPSLRDRVSAEEWDTRVQLAAAYRLADMHNWTTSLIYNHISARIPGEEEHILLHHTDTPAQHIHIPLLDVHAIHQKASLLDGIEPTYQVDNCTFSCACGPYDGQALAGLNAKRHASQHPVRSLVWGRCT